MANDTYLLFVAGVACGDIAGDDVTAVMSEGERARVGVGESEAGSMGEE